jgi:hypothetical protein
LRGSSAAPGSEQHDLYSTRSFVPYAEFGVITLNESGDPAGKAWMHRVIRDGAHHQIVRRMNRRRCLSCAQVALIPVQM